MSAAIPIARQLRRAGEARQNNIIAGCTRPTRSDSPLSQTTPIPRSVGRTESLWKGASRMDAARGVKGQGRPLDAGPWSNDGVRGVERSETRMSGACFFCLLFFAQAKKSEAPEGAQPTRPDTTDAAINAADRPTLQRTKPPRHCHHPIPHRLNSRVVLAVFRVHQKERFAFQLRAEGLYQPPFP